MVPFDKIKIRPTTVHSGCLHPRHLRWGSLEVAEGQGICNPSLIKELALVIVGERYCGTALRPRKRSSAAQVPQSCTLALLSPSFMGGSEQMAQ